MILRRIFLIFGFITLVIAIYGLLSQGAGIPAPGLIKGAASRTPDVIFDATSGVASIEISVLTYNVAGLPWPIACAKKLRQVDANNERIPIVCAGSDNPNRKTVK
jgi:hypothetical protein